MRDPSPQFSAGNRRIVLNGKPHTSVRGTAGEASAARYLETQGLKVIERQYKTSRGEVDLICRDKEDTWIFVEVKTRAKRSSLTALEAVTPAKQKKIVIAALSYLKQNRIKNKTIRFDVVALEADGVEWIPGAFVPAVEYTY